MKTNKGWIRTKYPWLLLVLSLTVLVFLNTFYLEHWLDSDMAAEMIFSKLLASQNHIFASSNWYYSTEFRILYTQLIMTPLFHFLSNWHVIRFITNLVCYLVLLLSYFYMMKPVPVSENQKVLTASLLLLPFSETMMLHMHMGNTYQCHVILVFFMVGMFIRLRNTTGWKKWILMACYIGLSILCGMSGIRYFLEIQCPVVLTSFILWVKSSSVQNYRHHTEEYKFNSMLQGDAWCGLLYSICGLFCSGVGYLINIGFIQKKYTFQTYESTNFIAIYQGRFLERLQDTFGSLIMLFGYIPDKGVLSLRGLVSIIAFLFLGLLVYITVKCYQTKNEINKLFVELFVISFLLNTFIFLFTNSTLVPRYYITTFVFVLPVIAIFFTEEKLAFDKAVIAILLIGCFTVATGKTELSMITNDKNAGRMGAIEYLVKNGYSFGYATYWNGNISQELSNGTLELANIMNPDSMEFFRWSSREDYYKEDCHADEKVFLLLTTEEEEKYQNAKALQIGEEIYRDDQFVVWGYIGKGEVLGVQHEN